MKEGRNSPWFKDRDEAIAGIARAASQWRNAVRWHLPKAFENSGPIKESLDGLARIHERLLAVFPPRTKKKPVSAWRHQTMYLLRREGGLTLAEAEELVRAAGLNTDYPDERRARTDQARTQKPPRQSTD